MIIPNTSELVISGIFDRGIPNQERIVLKPTAQINLAQYGVLLAFRIDDQSAAIPYNDHFLWLTERIVGPETTIFVYTCPGEFRETTVSNTLQPAIVFHWGKKNTILANTNVRPVLFRMDAIFIGGSIFNLPQSKALK